ncbi:5501_t:CDS:10, partial [Acaulospora colombiana]
CLARDWRQKIDSSSSGDDSDWKIACGCPPISHQLKNSTSLDDIASYYKRASKVHKKWRKAIKVQYEEKRSTVIRCPEAGCPSFLEFRDVKAFAPSDTFAKAEQGKGKAHCAGANREGVERRGVTARHLLLDTYLLEANYRTARIPEVFYCEKDGEKAGKRITIAIVIAMGVITGSHRYQSAVLVSQSDKSERRAEESLEPCRSVVSFGGLGPAEESTKTYLSYCDSFIVKLGPYPRDFTSETVKTRLSVYHEGQILQHFSYEELQNLENKTGQRVDVLIICGDFEAIRNEADLLCMAVPQKYYTGQKTAPVLTIVIGGNHEASNYLWELYVSSCSICSLISHRFTDIMEGPEVMLSHDWPEGIYNHGNMAYLLKTKPWFKESIDKKELGNPHMMTLLKTARPFWWFSAHMHVRFKAEYDHTGEGVSEWGRGAPSQARSAGPAVASTSTAQQKKGKSRQNDTSTGPAAASSSGAPSSSSIPSTTKFLALDKCLPDRKFLEIVDIPSPQDHFPARLTFDLEWLAISRAMHPLLLTERKHTVQPKMNLARGWVKTELEWVKKKIASVKSQQGEQGAPPGQTTGDELEIEISAIQEFVRTASGPSRTPAYTNPQTEAFCALIEVENKVNPLPS